MVAASSIGFVRHEGDIRKAGTVPLLRHPAHPCNIYGRPPPCKRFLQRCDLESRLPPSIRPVDAACRLLALMRSADRHPITLSSSAARCCTRVWPIPVRPVMPSRRQSPSQTEGEPGVPRTAASYGDEPAALSHAVLSPDPNLFVQSPGPPLHPDLSFPGAPRAATGKAGPPGPPPEAAWPCRSEHGAILPLVGIPSADGAFIAASRRRRFIRHGRLAVLLTARHHGPGDPRQLVGQRHHRDVDRPALQQSGKPGRSFAVP